MLKYDPGFARLPAFHEEISTLGRRVKRRASHVEFEMRRVWDGMAAARAHHE
jgi:hypothetical protein